jgi:hypothetical protein
MHDRTLCVGLSSWIIQDENYPDFELGEKAKFAIEFYSENGLTPGTGDAQLTQIRDERYQATGIVRFCADGVWVVDFGEVWAFCAERLPEGIAPGVIVSGGIHLGIDPFSYFERLYKLPGIPPLIYTWRIEGIAIETAPFVEAVDSFGRKMQVRDQTKLRRVSVAKTNAWSDDNGMGEYVLTCRFTGAPPCNDISTPLL